MKKIISLFFALVLIFTLVACNKTKAPDKSSYFTVEMGRKVFVEDETDMNLRKDTTFDIKEGYHFSNRINENLYIAYSRESLSDYDEEEYVDKYGVFDKNGNTVVECKYDRLSATGNFIFGNYYTEDIEYKSDIYYSNGNMILNTDYAIELQALSDDFCALYYGGYSQVFDKDGVYYFGTKNKMSGNIRYSICDDYLFGYDTALGDWFIWETYVSHSGDVPYGFVVLKRIFEGGNSLYSIAYLGGDKFLVVETTNANTDYDYFEVINGTKYYVRQRTAIYDVTQDSLKFYESEYPILSVVNHYSPTLTLEQKKELNFKVGFSRVNAGLVNENGERDDSRFFIIDDKGDFILRFPKNMNPSAMRFIDGYGFAGGASEGISAALYYMNCDTMWMKNDREYYSQSFASGRYVLSCSIGGAMRYGVLNTDGEVVVDFDFAYISPFVNGFAIFRRPDGSVGIMNTEGEVEKEINNFISISNTTVFGVFAFEEDDKIGLKTFDGAEIIPAHYDSLTYIGKTDGKLVIVMKKGDSETLYSFDY